MPKSRTYRCTGCTFPCELTIANPGAADKPGRCPFPPYEDDPSKWERVIPPHECGQHSIEYRSDENEWLLPVPYHKGEYIVCNYCPFCGEHLEGGQ